MKKEDETERGIISQVNSPDLDSVVSLTCTVGNAIEQMVMLHSLDISFEELVYAIFHQTGFNYKPMAMPGVWKALTDKSTPEEKQLAFVSFLKQHGIGLYIINITERQDKTMYDNPIYWLRFIRQYKIPFSVNLNGQGAEGLSKLSPPLYNWLNTEQNKQ